MSLLSANSLSSFSSFLTTNCLYNNRTCRTILFTIGAGVVISKIFSISRGLISLFPISKDLAARYGKGTWAVVTGSSDGIGRGFALELASRGFNIVLVSRSLSKNESVAQEIKERYPGIQTRIVVADFTQAFQEGFAENIYKQVKDLDISILVNNAGVSLGLQHYLDDEKLKAQNTEDDISDIRSLVVVNSLSHALIIRAFLPHLAARSQKSAIINLSSLISAVPFPKIQHYGASKAFMDYLSRGLAYEHPNIDILSFKPGFVTTKMIDNKKPDRETITIEQCVNSGLSALGNMDHTYGHWKHQAIYLGITNMSDYVFKLFLRLRFGVKPNEKKQ